MADELKALREYGYAPGNYTCQCYTCDAQFDGVKDAKRCRECASSAILAFQSEARAVPSASLPREADREAIAREWARPIAQAVMVWSVPHLKHIVSFNTLCEAIEAPLANLLALSPTPSAGRDGGGDDISAMAQFLCDRLDNLDWQDFEDTTRDFMGHVDPALSRLKKALAALPPATEKAEK